MSAEPNGIINDMNTGLEKTSGLKSQVNKYRILFRIPENLTHYPEEDYKIAERKYLKFSLIGHNVDSSPHAGYSEKLSDKS